MLSSIRWTLQFWHAAILVLAVAGIGAGSFYQIREAQYRQMDAQLETAAHLLVANLHQPGPHGGPDDHRPPQPGDLDFGSGNPDDLLGGMGPPLFDRGVPPEERLPRQFDLPDGFLQRFAGNPRDERSFVIYRTDRDVLAAWGAPLDPVKLPKVDFPTHSDKLVSTRDGDLHLFLLAAPAHTKVLTAGSTAGIDDQLRQLTWTLACTGGGIVLLGLTGGWYLSQNAVRPIRTMTSLAETISATHLSERIDVRTVPGELRDLARVLNAAFSRLEEAFGQQARFTADASHELRTPLTVVLSHTQLSLSRERSADEYRGTLAVCLSAAKRMKSLVDSLLLLSHADVGDLALDQHPLDLSGIVADSLTMLQPLMDEKQVLAQVDLQEVTINGDGVRLGQLVVNLITNAIRYNRVGGQVTVTCEQQGDRAVLSVNDTGLGISGENLPHIFDRFFRADKARSREAGGNGLGLAICKSIVDAHGGVITVNSEPGVGSTFTVRFPVYQVPVPLLVESSTAQGSPPGSGDAPETV